MIGEDERGCKLGDIEGGKEEGISNEGELDGKVQEV